MHESQMVAVGKHQTIPLEKGQTLSIERMFANAWHAKIQVNREVWIRCDGEAPEPDRGFCLFPEDGIQTVAVCADRMQVTTEDRGCLIQLQWYGRNGALID